MKYAFANVINCYLLKQPNWYDDLFRVTNQRFLSNPPIEANW